MQGECWPALLHARLKAFANELYDDVQNSRRYGRLAETLIEPASFASYTPSTEKHERQTVQLGCVAVDNTDFGYAKYCAGSRLLREAHNAFDNARRHHSGHSQTCAKCVENLTLSLPSLRREFVAFRWPLSVRFRVGTYVVRSAGDVLHGLINRMLHRLRQ